MQKQLVVQQASQMPWPGCNNVPPGHIHASQCPIPAHVQPWEPPCLPHSIPMSGNGGACSREHASTSGDHQEAPELARCHISCACHAALSTCPYCLLQSHFCTQQTASGTPSPLQLSSLLGLPSACQDLARGPSLSCQGGRVLHAPWGMHLTWGTHKLSPEASCCSICHNCHVADPLQSHCHLEWPSGDTGSPNCQDDSWGTSLCNRAGSASKCVCG